MEGGVGRGELGEEMGQERGSEGGREIEAGRGELRGGNWGRKRGIEAGKGKLRQGGGN